MLTSQTQPVSASASHHGQYGYDLDGNRTALTDGNGNTTYTTYNSLGQPETITEPTTASHSSARRLHHDGYLRCRRRPGHPGPARRRAGNRHLRRAGRRDRAVRRGRHRADREPLLHLRHRRAAADRRDQRRRDPGKLRLPAGHVRDVPVRRPRPAAVRVRIGGHLGVHVQRERPARLGRRRRGHVRLHLRQRRPPGDRRRRRVRYHRHLQLQLPGPGHPDLLRLGERHPVLRLRQPAPGGLGHRHHRRGGHGRRHRLRLQRQRRRHLDDHQRAGHLRRHDRDRHQHLRLRRGRPADLLDRHPVRRDRHDPGLRVRQQRQHDQRATASPTPTTPATS